MDEPYPGSNIFSLASGGAIYVRDPGKTLVDQQLNGGMIVPLTKKDWELILPYLEENERLFHIPIEDLLKVNGQKRKPAGGLSKGRALRRAGKLPKSSKMT